MDKLLARLSAAGLIDGQGNIVLERYDSGAYQAVDAETFRTMFGATLDATPEPGRYDALVAADAGRGYARFFDEWRRARIV